MKKAILLITLVLSGLLVLTGCEETYYREYPGYRTKVKTKYKTDKYGNVKKTTKWAFFMEF